MTHYVLHCSSEGLAPARLSCVRLAQTFSDRVRELYPPDAEPRAAALGFGYRDGGSGSESESEGDLSGEAEDGSEDRGPCGGGDPAQLEDPALWAAVSELQWSLASDRTIRPADVVRTLARLRADGLLRETQRGLLALVAALVAAYPDLRAESRSTLAQLVALGADMALSAAQSPDLLLYVKNELQAVNLAALLRG